MNKKKVFVKTFGCSLNFSDSDRIKAIVQEEFDIVSNIADADIIIINSCTVKNVAEEKLYRTIRLCKKLNKRVVVAGCVPQADKKIVETKLKAFSVIGTNNIKDIGFVLKNLDKRIVLLDRTHDTNKINITPKYNNTAIIPISEGCLGNCSYCKTKFARGNLKSYSINDIVLQVKKALDSGSKEIWLTSEDSFCYGFDINTNIVELLKNLININARFKIRVGMGNPNHLIKIIDEYLELFKSDKLYKFFHIPVQSGSDKILKDMNREYTVKDFETIVSKLRQKINKAFIATDIMVGYPIENTADFNQTLKLIKRLKPDMLNISRFWIRPGTLVARKYKSLPTEIIKERSQELTMLFESQIHTQKWFNWNGTVLITEKGKNNTLIGKNDYYKQIILTKNDVLKFNLKIGDFIKAKTQKVRKHDILAITIGVDN